MLHPTPIARLVASTTFPPAALPTYPTDNSGDTLSPTPPTDNPGDVSHQIAHFRLHGPGFLDAPLGPRQISQLISSSHPPNFTVRRASRRRKVIQSPGRWRARPRAANNTQARPAPHDPSTATPGAKLQALANLQADKLQKLIEILQGIAAARTGTNTPTAPQPPHIPVATTGEEEVILWEQVGT